MALSVLFPVAEMAPLAKVGGVGDVGAALPRALRRMDIDVRVALPYYAAVRRAELRPERVAGLRDGAALWRVDVREVPVYLIEHEPSFGREQVYGYEDDPARFLAFSDGLLDAARALDWRPDLIHGHDWHPGLLAARLAADRSHPWAGLPLVWTIHNLGYPGAFDEDFAAGRGLRDLLRPRGLAPEAALSGLAQAVLRADLVTTVSPTYARELRTPEYGGALAPALRGLGHRLTGILNGIDVDEFDPASDPHLVARFDAATLDRRAANKAALQERAGLENHADTPLVGMVTRLFEQKGSDLAVAAVERLLRAGARFQVVVLGQGEERYERELAGLAARHPRSVSVHLAFDVPFGQLIYGGCDVFLMPSRYEPCGLGQMIAMRYGAAPAVRRTGGLADSVQPYDGPAGTGTGFLFDEAAPDAVAGALTRAFEAYRERAAWRALQQRCLAQDFSWERAAREYAAAYERARRARAGD